MVRVTELWCRKSLLNVSLRLGFACGSWKTLSANPAVNGYLFQLVKDKAAKGEGWAFFISCVQDPVGY